MSHRVTAELHLLPCLTSHPSQYSVSLVIVPTKLSATLHLTQKTLPHVNVAVHKILKLFVKKQFQHFTEATDCVRIEVGLFLIC